MKSFKEWRESKPTIGGLGHELNCADWIQLSSGHWAGSDNFMYAESSDQLDPEMLGELFNRDPYELISFLRNKLREDSSLKFNIVANWVDVNTVRGAKAILDQYGSRLNIDSFTVRATREQYLQDVNAFESGVDWEEII